MHKAVLIKQTHAKAGTGTTADPRPPVFCVSVSSTCSMHQTETCRVNLSALLSWER